MSASGALLSFLGLKEPLGPAAGALEAAGDLLFNGAGRKALDEVSARLRAYVGAVPTNHDLEHALRLSMLTTSLVLVETFRRGVTATRECPLSAQLECPLLGVAR